MSRNELEKKGQYFSMFESSMTNNHNNRLTKLHVTYHLILRKDVPYLQPTNEERENE